MARFDEFKKSVGEAAEMLAEKAAGIAKVAAEKTKELAKIGKLNAEILAQKDDIRKAYQEIGKLYYEYFQVDPHEPMKAACEKIDAAMAIIADKQAEIEVLKAENPGEDFSEYEVVEDDDIVSVKAEVEVIVGKDADEDTIEEAVEEAAEAVEEVVEKITEN